MIYVKTITCIAVLCGVVSVAPGSKAAVLGPEIGRKNCFFLQTAKGVQRLQVPEVGMDPSDPTDSNPLVIIATFPARHLAMWLLSCWCTGVSRPLHINFSRM